MPFTEKSLRFLDENHARNDRDWFLRHKPEYDEHVRGPMLELAESLIPVMLKIDPILVLDPKRALCRIYRDTRFSRDKTMFKRASWFVFQRSKGMVHPVWFFEFTPDFHRYGCGYYATPPKIMNHVRELVLSGDRRYREAQKALDGLPEFSVEGEMFKRAHYPDADATRREWLERKSVTATHTSRDPKRLFAKKLPKMVADAFEALAPVYSFLMHAHVTAEGKGR